MSKFVCLYHVREQILVKRFELSCNLSLDAMEVSSGVGRLAGVLAPWALDHPWHMGGGYGKAEGYASPTAQKSLYPQDLASALSAGLYYLVRMLAG